MKILTFVCLVALFGQLGYAQHGSGYLVEYFPAPGQYINAGGIGTPEAAQKALEEVNSIVSLGSFGGYIIVQFEQACFNDPDNPYGVDFTIFGNSFSGSSEPGVVWVMKDENMNGLPDDTWYEIAGSNHFFSETVRDYEVTYYKTAGRDIQWKDNQGVAGVLPGNSFNLQNYYPLEQYFPEYPRDSVTFKGTRLENFYYTSANSEIKLAAPHFGYADSKPKSPGSDLSVPDNPYTPEVEGAGGDPIDISWAIDNQGNYADLDKIHFVKIVTAGLDEAGWLGENSTEVAWIEPVKPRPAVTGKENLLVVKPLPDKILVGEEVRPEAVYFTKGRKVDAAVRLQSSDEEVAAVNGDGLLAGIQAGTAQIRFSVEGEEQVVTIKVAEPQSIKVQNDFSAVYPGDTIELKADVYDNWQEVVTLNPHFSVSGGNAGKIINVDNSYYFVALLPGEIILTATVDAYQLQDQLHLKVLSPDDKVRVLVSVKSASENLLPLQWIEAGVTGLNGSVENRNNDYSGAARLNVAHVLAAGLNEAGASFAFRDDAAANGNLYLYKVEYDGLFSYGWGGKSMPVANARAWITSLNGKHYLNGFDTIPVADGDTVVLYHVPDIRESWNYTRLLPLETGEGQTTLKLEQAICYNEAGIITQMEFIPVTGAAVVAGEEYLTGPDGTVVVEHETLPLRVTSGIDAVLLAAEISTGVTIPAFIFSVYPNPVESSLHIDFTAEGFSGIVKKNIKLFDAYGGLLIEKVVFTGPAQLDMSVLSPGLYYLVVSDGKRSQIKKVIKR